MINSGLKLKNFIISLLKEKKTSDIAAITNKNNTIANTAIIASGTSTKHISAVADFVSLEIKQKTIFSTILAGINISNWVIISTEDIIVHLFTPEARKLYDIESLLDNKNEQICY